MNRRAWYILLAMIGLQLLAHSPHFGLGPRGIHVWRQCNTLATAKNYYQEDMHLLAPRVDHRKETNGVTGMPFPFYEYVLAGVYHITGFDHWPHRVLQFLIFQLGCVGLFLLLMLVFKDVRAAGFGTFFYMWSPELYYHSINALPDISALTAVIWAAYFYLDERRRFSTLLAVLFLTLAGLIKLQFLLFGLLFFAHALIHGRKDDIVGLPWMGLVSAGVTANWYIHSIHLRYGSQLHDYGLFLNPADNLTDAWTVLRQNILMDIPEQVLGFSALLLALVGLFLFLKRSPTRTILIGALAIAPFLAFHLLELKQMLHHAYYMMPYVLMASVFIAMAVKEFSGRNWTIVLFVLAGVQVGHALNKISPRYSDTESGIPVEFHDPALLTQLQDAAGGSHRAVIGPDGSGCIFFYYTGVKGWNIFQMHQLEKKDDVRIAIEKNKVDCLVIHQMDDERLSHYRQTFPDVQNVGDFTILKRSLHQSP